MKRSPPDRSHCHRLSPFPVSSSRRLERLWFGRKILDIALSDLEWRTFWFFTSGSPHVLEYACLPAFRTAGQENYDETEIFPCSLPKTWGRIQRTRLERSPVGCTVITCARCRRSHTPVCRGIAC
ncbi:hypothetical protein MRX96_027061 [Rhipicephalus microplus]